MHSIEAARDLALSLVRPTAPERVSLAGARGRTLQEEVAAAFDVPSAPTSMMDGYAVVAAGPSQRRVVAESAAGAPSLRSLALDEAAPISTGALLPPGADAVVPIEDTERTGLVLVRSPVRAQQFVRAPASDLRVGEPLLASGTRIDATAIALLAGQGRADVAVSTRPRVAVLSLGEELRDPGRPLEPGALYDSNGPSLVAACEALGATASLRPRVRDDLAALTNALLEIANADVILTSGGASVGTHDHLRDAITQAGGEVLLWRVAMKPGKPVVVARVGSTPIVGLPGNPVSALVSFLLFVRPMLLTMLGRSTTELPRLVLPLGAPLPRTGDRRELVRARIVEGKLVPEPRQASSALLGLHRADALIDCAPGLVREVGERVEALSIRDL